MAFFFLVGGWLNISLVTIERSVEDWLIALLVYSKPQCPAAQGRGNISAVWYLNLESFAISVTPVSKTIHSRHIM